MPPTWPNEEPDALDLALEQLAEANTAAAEYEVYREHFRTEIAQKLVIDVQVAHNTDQFLKVLLELQYAQKALHDGGTDDRLLAYLRCYRSIEWYRSEIGRVIVVALVEPFEQFFDDPTNVNPRTFLQPRMLDALRDRVIDEATGSSTLREKMRAFFNDHRELRNKIVHGLQVPTVEEARSCFDNAADIFNRAEQAFNPTTPARITFDYE